jgi:hypothetical protein
MKARSPQMFSMKDAGIENKNTFSKSVRCVFPDFRRQRKTKMKNRQKLDSKPG